MRKNTPSEGVYVLKKGIIVKLLCELEAYESHLRPIVGCSGPARAGQILVLLRHLLGKCGTQLFRDHAHHELEIKGNIGEFSKGLLIAFAWGITAKEDFPQYQSKCIHITGKCVESGARENLWGTVNKRSFGL